MEHQEMVKAELAIARPYNGGEWRLSKRVIGKRGGENWTPIYSCPATGGTWIGQLVKGQTYKVTYWGNGWPTSYTFVAGD